VGAVTAIYRDAATAKPFFHPVTTPSGRCLSRARPSDHPWHLGLWFAVKFVNGDNFWEETEPFGRVVSRTPGLADAVLDWVAPDGRCPLIEHRTLATGFDGNATCVDWHIRLTAAIDVLLDRTPYNGVWGGYGGLAFRGAGDWSDTSILLAGESAPDERVVGRRGAWCLLSSEEASVLLLDHPSNPRHPTPWYGSTRNPIYGNEPWSNFINAAFLFDEPLALGPGETVDIRHRVLVDDGRIPAPECESRWEVFADG
jgi:hypothetical protein